MSETFTLLLRHIFGRDNHRQFASDEITQAATVAYYIVSSPCRTQKFQKMRNSCYFPSRIRQVFSDFAVMISIIIMTFIDMYVGVNTPKLNVPSTFRVCAWLEHSFISVTLSCTSEQISPLFFRDNLLGISAPHKIFAYIDWGR